MKKLFELLFLLIGRSVTFKVIVGHQVFAQFFSGFLSFALYSLGILYFAENIYKYIRGCQTVYPLIKGLLTSMEFFFIAPIPLLITFSNRSYINEIFKDMLSNKNSPYLSPIEAKIGFISSLAGVVSTYLLGQFIDYLEPGIDSPIGTAVINYERLLILSLFILFFIIIIYYYSLLTSHKSKTE